MGKKGSTECATNFLLPRNRFYVEKRIWVCQKQQMRQLQVHSRPIADPRLIGTRYMALGCGVHLDILWCRRYLYTWPFPEFHFCDTTSQEAQKRWYMTMLKVMLTGHQSHIWGCSCHPYTNISALDDNNGLHWSPLLQMGSVRLLALHSSSVMW